MPSQYYGEFGSEFDAQTRAADQKFEIASNFQDASLHTGVGLVCAAVSGPFYLLASNTAANSFAQTVALGVSAGFGALALGFGAHAPRVAYHGARYALNLLKK